MKTHINLGGVVLCGNRSVLAATVNSCDCNRCNDRLERLYDILIRAVESGSALDRCRALDYADKVGFAVSTFRPTIENTTNEIRNV